MNAKLQTFINFFVRNNQLKNYLFFFVISVFLWFLSNLSQEYKYWLSIPIEYTKIPDGILRENLPKDTLQIEVAASGYQIIKLKMQQPVLKIPVAKLLNKKRLITGDYTNTINNLIGEENNILRIMPTQIDFKLSKMRKKKVKIQADISLKYRSGYKNKQNIKILPDSLWVFGLPKELDNLNQINTKPISLTDVSSDISGKIALDLPKGIKSNIKEVSYKIPVDQFVAMEIKLNYDLINVPDSVEVVLFPKNATVQYKVFESDYQKVNKDKIRVKLNFKDRDSVLHPELLIKDQYIFDARVHPDKVAFLIKNK